MVRNRSSLVVALVVVASAALGACGSDGRGTAADSGIVGTVTLGPSCPVAQQVDPCAARPFVAEVTVRDASDRKVAGARSDDAGRFRVDLPPGNYTVVPVSPRPNVPPVAPPVRVTVVAGRYAAVNIEYDTGIR